MSTEKTSPIRCLAIDDEPLALRQLATCIEKTDFLTLTAACQSANEAAACLEKEQVDVIFTDINMPDQNGLEFIQSLEQAPQVVFTTAYSEYAIDAYKIDATGYLLKPFSMSDFTRVANKVKKRFELEHTASISSVDEDSSLFFRTEHRIVRVVIKDIKYIEGMSEYLKIHIDGKRPLVVLLSMKLIEERLAPSGFLRVHRSYIINLKRLQEITKNRVVLEGDVELPIGDLYRDGLKAYIAGKFIGK